MHAMQAECACLEPKRNAIVTSLLQPGYDIHMLGVDMRGIDKPVDFRLYVLSLLSSFSPSPLALPPFLLALSLPPLSTLSHSSVSLEKDLDLSGKSYALNCSH